MRIRIAALVTVLLVAACGSPAPSAPAETTAQPPHSHGSAPPSSPLRAGERFVDLALPKPYAPKAPNGGTDEYRCFVVDPGLTDPAFLTGSRFLPDNETIVHHAIFYRLGPEHADAAADLDARTPGEGWTCFGDSGVGGETPWVAHWAPGAGETLIPAGYGFEMPPGSKLVMQVHYSLLGVKAGEPADRSGIRMRLTGPGVTREPLRTELVSAPIELPCEPGTTGPLCDREAAIADVAARFGQNSGLYVDQLNQWCNDGAEPVPGTTQHCDVPVDEAGTIHLVAGHMHLLGRSIKVELNPGTSAATTVLDVPEYNFDNQALLAPPRPVEVKTGDTVRVTCTHDAKLRTMLPQLRDQPPRYVVWGEGTSDEMCLGILVMSR